MNKTTLFGALLTLLISFNNFAQNNKNSNTAYPDDEIPFYIKDGVKYSQRDNTPLLFAGINDPVKGGSPEDMAIDWLTHHKDEIKINEIHDLVVYSERRGPSGSNVRFRQFFLGIPVYQSEIVVHISPKNTVTYVYNAFNAGLDEISVNPSLSEDKALNLAKKHLDVKGNIHFSSVELMIYNHDEQTKLVYKVALEPEQPLGSYEVLVDGHSGDIVRSVDKACNHLGHEHSSPILPPPVNGTGNVFLPDPLSVALVMYGSPYTDGNDATNASLDATMSSVPLLDINFTGSAYQLVGPYAEIQDFENPFKGLFSQASSVFNYNRNNDAFEAVNCYYHIDNNMRYINLILGIPLMPFQYSTGVRFDPSGLNGQDNSHYLPASGKLAFGEGGVDDAEDADVVLHELGHGIHDWLTNGNLSQVNGLSEGSGDYWAQSYSRSLNQWSVTDPQYQWMFSWDGHNSFWSGRITNYSATYPGGLTGAIHTDGQIWASALMRIYDIIGQNKVDRAFLEGLAMTGGSTNQQDAAIAVRQAAIDMNYSCADIDVFTQEFTITGYVLPALPQPSGVENSTICAGESIIVNGTVYDANNPTGTEVIPGATAACDSTVTINLTVLPAVTGSFNATICTGESVTVNGSVYDENNPSGTEVIPNGSVNGCDSTINVNLVVIPPVTSTLNLTLCTGESLVVNGTTYDSNNPSGTEVFTAASVNGCDSTVNISLSFSNSLSSNLNSAICDGESIVVNGTVYNASNPTGTEVFTNVGPNGCDSTVYINLTALAPLTGSETSTICSNESITVNGTIYNANNTSGTEVFTNVGLNGCDSTVTVNLTVLSTTSGSVTNTLCYSESVIVNGTTYDVNNPSGTEVFTAGGMNGCDSVVTVNLTFESVIDVSITSSEPTLTANQSGAIYQWLDCDNGNATIPGETNQSFTAGSNGNYAVAITVGNCTETSVCASVSNIGIEENELNSVTIYPNPSDGLFVLSVENNQELLYYTVYSTDGKLILSSSPHGETGIIIDLSAESKGIYFLNLMFQYDNRVFKLVLE